MKSAIKMIEIWKFFASGEIEKRQDWALREKFLALEVDGKEELAVILTPEDEENWALGHLRCRRMILTMDDVESISTETGKITVKRKNLRGGIPLRNRIVHTASTCIVEGGNLMTTCPAPLTPAWNITFAAVQTAVENLASAPLFRLTGNVHVAVLASLSGKTLYRVEDVGRHNAVDKTVGWALRQGIDMGECFMAVSGRLPADMVYKAIGAGIPLLASVSAATASGIEAADRGGITLIGFAREGRMNVYTHPQRLNPPAHKEPRGEKHTP